MENPIIRTLNLKRQFIKLNLSGISNHKIVKKDSRQKGNLVFLYTEKSMVLVYHGKNL